MAASYTSPPSTLALPRILCLHGGGVSAQVFHIQCRPLMSRLEPHFRLVFVNGPFASDMHASLVPYYGTLAAGCRRWSAWLPEHEMLSDAATVDAIEECLTAAMRDDSDRNGATGDWVGLLGFSQGAKLAISILLENQMRVDAYVRAQRGGLSGATSRAHSRATSRAHSRVPSRTGSPTLDSKTATSDPKPSLDVDTLSFKISNIGNNNNSNGNNNISNGNNNNNNNNRNSSGGLVPNGVSSNTLGSELLALSFNPPAEDLFAGAAWRFGVILAGRAKPANLGCGTRELSSLPAPSSSSSKPSSDRRYFDMLGELPVEGTETAAFPRRLRLRTPTLHVHGLRDEGLSLHRQLSRDFTVSGSACVLEWDADHRIVVKDPDLSRVVESIMETARAAGCLDR